MFILMQFRVKHINIRQSILMLAHRRDDKIEPVVEFHPELFYYLGLMFIVNNILLTLSTLTQRTVL